MKNTCWKRLFSSAAPPLLTAAALWTGSACQSSNGASLRPTPETKVYVGANAFAIPPAEFPQLKIRAEKGDAAAAEQLSLYYGMLMLDDDLGLYYARLAAKHGGKRERRSLRIYLESLRTAKIRR